MATESKTIVKRCPLCGSEAMHERVLNEIDLLRCRQCAFVYSSLDDVAIEQANFHFDEGVVQRYRTMQTWVDRHWFADIVERITRRTGGVGTVLDVGCGNGTLLREFVKQGWQGWGVDPSPWAVRCAEGYEVCQSTLHEANFPDGRFEAVTNTAVLEHVAQPRPYVEEVLRILKPGGCAYFNVPNYGSVSIRLGYASFHSNAPPWHADFFTHKTLYEFFSGYGGALAKISVRSYGIPEAYRGYVIAHQLLGRLSRGRRQRSNASKTTGSDRTVSDRNGKRLIAGLLGKVYYHAGRPFKLGDKLEVMVVKAR